MALGCPRSPLQRLDDQEESTWFGGESGRSLNCPSHARHAGRHRTPAIATAGSRMASVRSCARSAFVCSASTNPESRPRARSTSASNAPRNSRLIPLPAPSRVGSRVIGEVRHRRRCGRRPSQGTTMNDFAKWRERPTNSDQLLLLHDCEPDMTGVVAPNKNECPVCGEPVPGYFKLRRAAFRPL
jgi:hypothetical protein